MAKFLIVSILSLFPFFSQAQEINLLILNNEFDKALQIINTELTKNEGQPLLYLKKGIIQQKLFDYSGAIISLERAYQLDSLNPNILSEIAEANSSLGNYRRALPYLKALYRADTTNTVSALKLVRVYFNLRNYIEPFKILNSCRQRDSTNLVINKQLALCAARTDHNDLSISLYQQVIKLNPTDLANYTNLASVYQNKDQNIKVTETLGKGLIFFPDEPVLLTRLGDFQFQLKEYALAIIPYEKYLAQGDSIPQIIKNLGICYYFERRYKEGINLLGRSLQINPDDPIVALYLGLCYESKGKLKQSIEYLNFASEIAVPTYLTDIYHHLGNVYKLNHEYTKSIRALKKAYELDSTKYTVLFEIATIYETLQNNKNQAIKYYDDYLKSDREDNVNSRKLTQYVVERKRILKAELTAEKKRL